MASIITESYRKTIARLLYNSITSNVDKHYVTIGKYDEWYDSAVADQPTFPLGTYSDEQDVKKACTDVLTITSAYKVIPRIEASGYRHKEYDPYDPTCFYKTGNVQPCYITELSNNRIYLCLQAPANTVLPANSLKDITTDFVSVSGYVFAYVGDLIQNSYINNEKFIQYNPASISTPYSPGKIFGLSVRSGGSGWSDGSINVKIYDGYAPNKAPLDYTVNLVTDFSGKVTSVSVTDIKYLNNGNTGFRKPFVVIENPQNGATDLILVPRVSSIDGFGHTPEDTLPCWYTGVIANTRNANLHPFFHRYAQVGLARNLKLTNGNPITTASASNLSSFVIAGYADEVVAGTKISQSISSVTRNIGVVHSYDSATQTIYYTQNYGAGVCDPQSAYPIVLDETDTGISPTVITPTVIDHLTGDILFIDNRAYITRAEDQNEELKIVLQH